MNKRTFTKSQFYELSSLDPFPIHQFISPLISNTWMSELRKMHMKIINTKKRELSGSCRSIKRTFLFIIENSILRFFTYNIVIYEQWMCAFKSSISFYSFSIYNIIIYVWKEILPSSKRRKEIPVGKFAIYS